MLDERRDLSTTEIVLLVGGVAAALAGGTRVLIKWLESGLDAVGWLILGASVLGLVAVISAISVAHERRITRLEKSLDGLATGPVVIVANVRRFRRAVIEAAEASSDIRPGERLDFAVTDFLVRRRGPIEAVRTSQAYWALEFTAEELVVWADARDPFAILRVPRSAIRDVVASAYSSVQPAALWTFVTDRGDLTFLPLARSRVGNLTLREPGSKRAVARILAWCSGSPVGEAAG